MHYPQILIKLIEDYNLEQYTLIALGRLESGEDGLAANEPGKLLSARPVNAIISGSDKRKITVTLPAVPAYPSGEFVLNLSLIHI